ncbi:uncharacterized protein LOC135262003 isoform X1 [Anguilla rostrata]|uniref:uncharacterized protein LOC135262003 isoform X1 n=1 Tax=Anguilla rostrata TaxID=7938 RepID=UPI0030CD6AC2
MDSKMVSLLYGIILVTGMNIAGTYAQRECTKRKVDLAFLFDGSESLTARDFKKNKDFIADMMKTLSNAPIQFAAMQFSKKSRTVFTFKDYQEKTALDLLEKEQHMKDLTNTYGAMNNVLQSILNSTTAGAIPDATKVLVIITDGNPSDKDWKKVVKTMDDRHITRYVIGVGNVARETLTALSSHLSNKNTTFPMNDYDGLKGVLDSLQKQIYNIEDFQKSNRLDALEEENRELSISLSSVEQRLAVTERKLEELQVRHRNASETLSTYRDIKRNLEELQVKHRDLWKIISHYNECTKRKVDLAFLFDGSESLKADDFKKNKDFIADMMKTLSNTSTQFAAMQFSKTSRIVFTFKDYQEKKALDLLEKEQHMKDLTNTYGAMYNVLHSILNNTTAGAIPDATKVLVIITDGNPSDKDWKRVVKTMDDRHITRYVIGVGNVARETLTALSSHLLNKNTTFPINDYNGLKGVLDSLQKQIYNIED